MFLGQKIGCLGNNTTCFGYHWSKSIWSQSWNKKRGYSGAVARKF